MSEEAKLLGLLSVVDFNDTPHKGSLIFVHFIS